MKIELDEKDKIRIDGINKDIEENKEPFLLINQVDHDYYLNFRCLDIAKANNFIGMLLCPNKELSDMFEENFGIRVNSLNYCHGDDKISTLKSQLKKFLEDLDTIH